MLSLLLTEIQENESNIMFAFTANRVEMLPPEFVDRSNAKFCLDILHRKSNSRFSRFAFVDLRISMVIKRFLGILTTIR